MGIDLGLKYTGFSISDKEAKNAYVFNEENKSFKIRYQVII